MSKFFTRACALLLACFPWGLASEEMPAVPPVAALEAPAALAEGGVSLPKPLEAGRYAALAKKSPFTLASATQENADFAKDLALAGYVRLQGKEYVMISKKNGPERFMVGTEPSPSAQGMILQKVDRDPGGDPTKMSAVIRKGTEVATLRYESSASPVAPPPAVTPVPGQAQPGPATTQAAPANNPPVIRRRVVPIAPPPTP